VLECVVNVSEGRDGAVLAALRDAAGDSLLDVHTDPHHHRSVLTLLGEDAARSVAAVAVERIDLRTHSGVHPRLGAVDVVPFVALEGSTVVDAVRARDDFAAWFARTHEVPCFAYGPERTLPEVRRRAFHGLDPSVGPAAPHPTAGATAVGARPVLVAFNLWLDGDLPTARAIAAAVRGPAIRALGLPVGDRVQVSMNLIAPDEVGPARAYDLVAGAASERGARVDGAELVGLLPASVLARIPASRWAELDLDEDRTIEARLARAH
jgi:glutamate formiminotransferase/glutamate formiminotransferase/formiminotetrahydrofolate cyclodeaminase